MADDDVRRNEGEKAMMKKRVTGWGMMGSLVLGLLIGSWMNTAEAGVDHDARQTRALERMATSLSRMAKCR